MISNINTKLSTAAPQRTQSAARPEQAAQAASALRPRFTTSLFSAFT